MTSLSDGALALISMLSVFMYCRVSRFLDCRYWGFRVLG